MGRMNPFAKSALAFVVLFAVFAAGDFVLDTLVRHEAFGLDLAWTLGVSAGGAVVLLVRELTSEDG